MNKQNDLSPQLDYRLRRRLFLYGVLLGVNILLFSWTSPLESPALVVIIGFIVASIDIFVAVRLLVRFICVLAPKMTTYKRRLTFSVTSFSVFALALASLGQLTSRDVIVVLIIWILGYMYSLRFNVKLTKS